MQWKATLVGDDGTKLAYIDSGAPPTSTYATIVLVHGHTFHAPIFSRLLPLAQEYNLRLIALNRRDYVNSTPYSEADLGIISGSDEFAQIQFLSARGLEIARFLCWVVEELKIPRPDAAKSSGGLALLGWSLGSLTTLAFLAHLESYPSGIIQILEPHLRTFFIYSIPFQFLGYPDPPGSYNPVNVPENPARIAPPMFAAWLSTYYKHPAYSKAQSFSSLTLMSFIQHIPEEPYRPCSTDTMSTDELSTVLDLTPNARSERFYCYMSVPMLHGMTDRAVRGEDSFLLPAMKVYFHWGLEDCWLMPWAACEFERDLAKWRAEGKKLRPIEVVPVADANHFMHWDDPKLFLELITKCVRSRS